MRIRSFKELCRDLIKIDFTKTNKNIVTGEEYEDWNKSRFIKAINNVDNKSEIVKIKPCPICGCKAKLITTYDREQIICTYCKARTEIEIGDYYDEGFMDGSYVIPQWNRGDVNNTSKILKEEECKI